jgi:hypothetical protein
MIERVAHVSRGISLAHEQLGILDALGYDSPHLVGVSTVAAPYAQRVRTVTSIRSATGARRSGERNAQPGPGTAPGPVLHGDRDRMAHPTGAVATAQVIAGARLETIRGMGHDLPKGTWPILLDLIDTPARDGAPPAPTRRTDASTTS